MTEEDLPLVSVITPSLNQGRFIEETIRSVKSQDYPRLEHLIIDGGSTDGTLEILRRYVHLIWVSEPDRGQADAVNKGICLAKGEIIGWLNSDDLLAPGAMRTVADHLVTHEGVDIVYGDCQEIDGAGRPLRLFKGHRFDLGDLLLLNFVLCQPAFFFRRRVFDKIGLLNARLHLVMDYELLVRAARRGCAFDYLPVPLAAYRTYPESKTSTRSRNFLVEHLLTFDEFFTDPALPREVARLRRQAYSNAYLAGGVRSYESGAREEARDRLLQSLLLYSHPFRAKTLKAVLLLLDTVLGVEVGNKVVQWLRRFSVRR